MILCRRSSSSSGCTNDEEGLRWGMLLLSIAVVGPLLGCGQQGGSGH
jgi:hypothetical protein